MGEFLDFIYQDVKYKVYVPGDYHEAQEYPMLVMLHGCGQNPDDFAIGTNMNTLAEKEKFFVLYPDMNKFFNPTNLAGYNPYGCWNWFLDQNQHRGNGHPKLIFEIIQEVKRKYTIDSNRVYAAGLSAGGSLACILGATYPEVFNGIGICAGLAYGAANVFLLTDPMADGAKQKMEKGVPDPFSCGNRAFIEMGENRKKMRVIVFHGISDTIVHPINGQQVITQWAQTNFLVDGGIGRVDVTPSLIHSDIMNGKSYTQHVYLDVDDEPLMELWMVDNMGHTWSGGNPNGSYTDPSGPNATEIIWNFFNQPQQQTEKRLMNDLAQYPTPAPPLELIVHPTVQPSTEDAPELSKPSSVKETIEATEKTQHERTNESPIKTFFSNLISKLRKK
ncbi:extracellular catalytic domain type 1 short-chain-length polyhydroxyalkanoate depolymerase [Niallia sp. Krafla_26]|uniref:extracellular catalytic domain type 1 short-chain-length polyhydroxyalkanoate depolymerase n=1 Tax=Niallia sp. Krafla_26 TaxID=3064703 RepID=UPI003D17319B